MSNEENPCLQGSNPCRAANFPEENELSGKSRTDSAQNAAESESEDNVRFPKRIKHRGKVLAVIYGKSKAYPFYRVAAYVAGKRRMSSYATYSQAKATADKLVRDLAKGSQAAALTGAQALDALAALESLQSFRQDTGRRLSLLAAVSEFTEAAKRLNGHTLGEAVDGFLNSVVTVKRVNLHEAIEQFISFRKGKTVAGEGRRPQLSFDHWRNTGYWLREFSETFPGHAVCDLTKQHLDTYMAKFAKAAPKTRNERRGVVKMFLGWCVEQDFLAPTHRLLEASQLKHENADVETIECYSASELRLMLEAADTDLRPVIALAGLGGLREKEILRLTWADIFRVPGHIEVGALKAKTRSRRLVEAVCLTERDKEGHEYKLPASLFQWLEPYRERTGAIWGKGYHKFHEEFARLRGDLEIPHRRNGLRHAFVTFHYALHADEGLTAKQAGNSPAMVHKNYKGLATAKEAEAWFAVAPARAANVIHLATAEK